MFKKLSNLFNCLGEFWIEWGDTVTIRPLTTESIEDYKAKYNLGSEPDESPYTAIDTRNLDPLQVDSEAIRKDWQRVGLLLQESMNHVRRTK